MTQADPPHIVPARWRIGVVEDHVRLVVQSLEHMLEPHADLEVVGGAETVPDLLAQWTNLDMVVLDLRDLKDDLGPKHNVETLQRAGIDKILVYTHGSADALIRQAVKAGALAVILKNASEDVLVAAIRSVAHGMPVGSVALAAAIDGDSDFRSQLAEPEADIIAKFASGEILCDVASLLGTTEQEIVAQLKIITEKYVCARGTDNIPHLSRRELQVLKLYVSGETARSVAGLLQLKQTTVDDYLSEIRKKFAPPGGPNPSKTQLVHLARRAGLVP
ncbi:LuxR C-terminal-related transcriptional regulator [Nocardia sp. NPDC004860]|uniref:LuxR C-terminal-related transcriptional regulator n=1 Tax=Nocardia sp. NPDC004860 TaxID=3154557 RepID=UPI0033B24375